MSRGRRYSVPTVDALLEICRNDRDLAVKVQDVLSERVNPIDVSAAAKSWVESCYHRPDEYGHECKLIACDELLDGCGVESLDMGEDDPNSHTDEGIRMCPAFSYVNFGDPYVATLLRDHDAETWVIAGWGDVADEYQQENEMGDYQRFSEEPESCPSCWTMGKFDLESFKRGETCAYCWVCKSCGHSCLADDDFQPEVSE